MTTGNDGTGRRPLRPSQVLERIRAEHGKLRDKLDALEALAKDVLGSGDREAARRLREAAADFHASLVRHIDIEDHILIPVIRDADGYGEERARELAAEHLAQRQWLDLVMGPVARKASPPVRLGDRVLRFVAGVRKDMEQEEKDYVNDHLLRDDIIQLGFID